MKQRLENINNSQNLLMILLKLEMHFYKKRCPAILKNCVGFKTFKGIII